MELSFQTLPMRYLGNPIQGSQTQEQTAEVIVPDSCPDVARIVYTSASVIVRGKECRTGSVLVSGGIRASALCIPEDDSGARTLESYLPFSLRIEHPGVTERTQAVVSAFVRQIDARLIHSRKILIRADLCCTAECLTAEEETLYALSAPPKELQTKRRTYPVSLPKETAEKSFTVTDDLTLPTGKPFASEICCYETVPRITDCKVIGSKAVFKGTLEVNMLYLSGDGSVQTWEQQLPFSQYAELAEDYDEASLCVTPLVSAAELTLEPSGEGRAMSLAVTLNAQCLVSGPVTMELIEDAYAVGAALEPAWTQYALACRLDCQTLRDEVRQQLAADAEAVLECAVYHDLPYFERAEGKLRVRAPLNMKLLYRDKDGALQGAAARAEAACETALCENASCAASVCVDDCYAQPGVSETELHAEVSFTLLCSAVQQLRTLSGGTLTQNTQMEPERPSVVLRACRGDEDIWDVAKRYGTTVAAVREANGLESGEPERDCMLLIPM